MGEESVATIKMVDQKGKAYQHPVEVSFSLVSNGATSAETVSGRGVGGQYKIHYTPQRRGLHHLHIKVEDKPITGSPFPLSVITPAPTDIITGVFGPRGSALDSEGQLVVAEYSKHRLSVFNSDGQRSKSFGTKGCGPGQLNLPCGVAFSSTGDILVADQYVSRFSPPGENR